MSLPEQVILWDNPDGTRQSEHRSIGDASQQCWWSVGGIDIFVRQPRPDDRFWAVCCTDRRGCQAQPWCKRPTVIAVFRERDDAYGFAKAHADAHTLARLPFWRRRAQLYRRQARVERALCG